MPSLYCGLFTEWENAETTSLGPPSFSSGANVFTVHPSAVGVLPVYIQLNEWMNDFQQLNLVISSNPYFLSVVMSSFLVQNRSSNFPRDTYTAKAAALTLLRRNISLYSRCTVLYISYLSLYSTSLDPFVLVSLVAHRINAQKLNLLKQSSWKDMPFMYYYYFFFRPSFFLFFYVYTLDGQNFAFMCTHKTTGASGISPRWRYMVLWVMILSAYRLGANSRKDQYTCQQLTSQLGPLSRLLQRAMIPEPRATASSRPSRQARIPAITVTIKRPAAARSPATATINMT